MFKSKLRDCLFLKIYSPSERTPALNFISKAMAFLNVCRALSEIHNIKENNFISKRLI